LENLGANVSIFWKKIVKKEHPTTDWIHLKVSLPKLKPAHLKHKHSIVRHNKNINRQHSWDSACCPINNIHMPKSSETQNPAAQVQESK
jgi:hypothetical protein